MLLPPPFWQGALKRWEQIAVFVRTRSLEEVITLVKHKAGMSAARMNAQDDYKAGQKKRAEVTCQVRGAGKGKNGEENKGV